MALIIAIRCNRTFSNTLECTVIVVHSEREGEKWFIGLSDFHHNYLIRNDIIQHSGEISFATPN